MMFDKVSPPAAGRALVPNLWDAVAFVLVVGAMVLVVHGARDMTASLAALETTPVSLDPASLPEYALRTTLRMLAAIVCSLIFSFVYAALAARSWGAEAPAHQAKNPAIASPTPLLECLFAGSARPGD